MSRKDDPVFNVKFVQLVESNPCLWNSTHPGYSKKEIIQKAWQEVANETKDTVRNCRERWRTIRSSFLRSLKLSRTTTGRGKRKYYLSKYLQFLIPYTKTRLKNGANIIALRKPTAAAAVVCLQPMTRISNMPVPIISSDDTKDSTTSEVAIAEGDVLVSVHEEAALQQEYQQRLAAIKLERGTNVSPQTANISTTATTTTTAIFASGHQNFQRDQCLRNTVTTASAAATANGYLPEQQQHTRSSSSVDLMEFAEWIKSKNEHRRHCLMSTLPDADQSFLNSLHPFLKEMSGKQNRRFRQKVVALIDSILDNIDV